MWEYFYYESPGYADTVQNFTIFDSTDSHSIIHLRQYGRNINPITYPYLLRDTTRYWIDTTNYYVYGPGFENDSALVYKLNAKLGDQWITWIAGEKIFSYEMARVTDKWEGTLFGKQTTFMNISYYGTGDSTDTIGLGRYGDEIADGFGLIYRGESEGGGQIHLTGVVTNGIQYGDTTVVSSVKDGNFFFPSSVELKQNYPNPFNPVTTIKYTIPQLSFVTIKIYDLLGREIETLVNLEQSSGNYEVEFNAKNLSSGIYIYTIRAGSFAETKKMTLIK